jgi:hypothetical protein
MHETAELRARLQELVDQAAAAGIRELPSLRDLAAQFEVAPNTVKKVLLELDGEARVFAVHGRGFFLHLPGDPEPGLPEPEPTPGEATEEPPPEPWHIPVDERYSPVPEEGRATRKERRGGRDFVVVVGQILRAIDPTGAPSNRFLRSVEVREHLQYMGYQLSWAPIGYDGHGQLDAMATKALQLQLASLGDRLAGILLLDPGYGRSQPLWDLATDATDQPVVWFHTAPVAPEEQPEQLPSNAHVLEPDWAALGLALADHLVANHAPQKVLLLPAPGEKGLPPQLAVLRETLLNRWGPRWLATLEWFDVFPEGLPKDPTRSFAGKLRRLLLDTGLTRYELDRFFAAASSLGAPLWVCADDLLALSALDHFDARNAPNDPRPGVLGFGNHPFSLAKGLCTVDPSWNTLVERAIELFTGYGRRSRLAVPRVIDAPSESVYGGNILGRSGDRW